MTAEAWYLALEASGQFYSQQRDAQRLLEAFKIILPKLKYWPAPSDILENLPKVEKVKQIEAEISPTSDELRQAQANWSLIYQVIEGKITQEEAIRTWEENAKPK